ncbi:DUF6804 family protein [Riemerella anatipestifer]|uniref:DUF6804 family protein n=1 Tax=Riemerella anatipestifer TaxID=34085 RepID=UPI000B03CB94|nr:DUF6804 family protein [Riemerella anatipestifer]
MNLIKILLPFLLLICIFDMPYGYYQLVRFIALICFSMLAYQYKNNHTLLVIFISLALLFQPFIKIVLGRTLWNIIDVVVAIFLLILLKVEHKDEK